MGGTFARLKNWTALETLTDTDLDAEFDWFLANFTPSGMDDYSASVAQMKLQTNPGAQGTESQATSLAGEIERLRYVINRITGETYWYDAPDISLSDANTALAASNAVPRNRIVSGKTRSATDAFPIFLRPDGTAATLNLFGASTNFKIYIDGTLYTHTTDITKTGLSLAPSSNNTCLINDSALAAQTASKYAGEFDSAFPVLTVDTMGSEISALVGKYAAFKVGTEYFVAFVQSTTQLTHVRRGFFFDSSDAPFTRVTVSDNDTITLCKLHWVFYKTTGVMVTTTSVPVYASDTPTSPASGDYWFDLTNLTWKTYDGSTWATAGVHLIGIAVTDTAGCKAARSFEPYAGFSELSTLSLEKVDSATMRGTLRNVFASINGAMYSWAQSYPTWSMTTDIESGYAEGASTDYYFYVTERGDVQISPEKPYDRRADLRSYYHPYHMWRAFGYAINDGSSNLGDPTNYPDFTHRTQTFTSSGNFFSAEGGEYLVIGRGGAGGGGGGGSDTAGGSGAGGGGGGGGVKSGYIRTTLAPGTYYPVVIAAGGTAGAAGTYNNNNATAGGTGGNTTFNGITFYGSAGGSPGQYGSLGSNNPGGAGGAARLAHMCGTGGTGGTGSFGGGAGQNGATGGDSEFAAGAAGGAGNGVSGGGGGGGGGGGDTLGGGTGGAGGGTPAVGVAGTGGTGGGGGGGAGDGSGLAGAAGAAGSAGSLTLIKLT